MSDHDLLDRLPQSEEHTSLDEHDEHDERTAAYFDFLESEFPAWDFDLDATETWSGDARQLWTATREGHHPQAALTAAKLHRRLGDYEDRQSARHAGPN